MVMSFRVSELQVLLAFSGRNRSGRKHELLAKALQLLRSGCSAAVQMKIAELYRRRFPRRALSPSELPVLHGPVGPLPPLPAPCRLPYEPGAGGPLLVLESRREAEGAQLAPPVQPVHPDVKMQRLPFYDVYDELIKPTTLASASSQRFEEAHFTFALTPQQVQQILSSRDAVLGARCDHAVQVQLRFCLCETSCPQEDHFPPNLFVKVNGKLCPLPGYLPPTKNGVEPKRPSRPVNITPLALLSAALPNTIVVNWSAECGRNYSLSVYLVKQLTAVALLQKLRAKGIRNPDHSRALIKEKLTADPDSEVATTSLRVSLMCPLGKMRLAVPCRATTCSHLQCFDAALYLQMNEKKPTWMCPVCDRGAPYDRLIIDGLFMEILNSCTDCDEIEFMEDGSWCPMRHRKEKRELCGAADLAPSLYAGSPEAAPPPPPEVEVIDLTLDSSSDEEGPPPRKHCGTPGAAHPTAGPRGALSAAPRPSSVLRCPTAALCSEFPPTIPDFTPSYTAAPELRGLDLLSFLHDDSQRCGRSVITSLRAADPLGRFLPPAGGAALRDGRRVGSAAPPPRRSNVISLD